MDGGSLASLLHTTSSSDAALNERTSLLGSSALTTTPAVAAATTTTHFKVPNGSDAQTGGDVVRTAAPSRRLDFLDQFRGFTMVSMIIVNFLADSGFYATPAFFRHGEFYVSFPDLIMPGFLFASGLSFRLSHQRTVSKLGAWRARAKVVVPRALGLLIVSYWLYGFGMPRPMWDERDAVPPGDKVVDFLYGSYFGALTQIALTMLWSLPVIERSATVRVVYAVVSQWLYVGFTIWVFNGAVGGTNYDVLDGEEGGPFGFLAWSFPFLTGSICYDWLERVGMSSPHDRHIDDDDDDATFRKAGVHARWSRAVNWVLGRDPSKMRVLSHTAKRSLWMQAGLGAALVVVAYLLSLLALVIPMLCYDSADVTAANCTVVAVPLPPLVVPTDPNASAVTGWNMVEAWPTFMLATTGFQLIFCAVCFWVADVARWRVRALHTTFDAFGRNTLLAYYFHYGARRSVQEFMPIDAPGGIVFLGLCMCLGSLTLAMFHLRHHKMFVSV